MPTPPSRTARPAPSRVVFAAALAAVLTASLASGCFARQPSDQAEEQRPARATPQVEPQVQADARPRASAEDKPAWRLTPNATMIYDFLLFEELKRSTKTDEAEEAIRQVLAGKPSPQVYLEAANFYWTRRNQSAAVDTLKQGIEKFPEDWQLSLFLASLYLAEKRTDDAVLTIRDHLSRNPADQAAREGLGQLLVEAQQYDQAVRELTSIPEDKRTPAAQLALAQATFRLGRPGDAGRSETILTDLLAKQPTLLEAWAELAYEYEVGKNYEAAEKAYSHILDAGGEVGQEVKLRLVRLNLRLNRPDRALALAQEESGNPAFVQEAATAFISDGHYAQAGTLLAPQDPMAPGWNGKAPSDDIAYLLAVVAYEGNHDAAKGLAYLDRIPAASSLGRRSVHFRAHLLYTLGRKAEALETLEQGRSAPDAPKEVWLLESGIVEADGDNGRALDIVLDARKRWPEDTELLFREGALYERLGRRQEALEAMNAILVKEPDNADALNFVGYSLADSGQDLPRALDMVQAALKQKPDSGYIVDSLAWVYFRMGKLDQAWKEIRRAVSLMDKDPTVWEHYGDIAKAMGKRKEAVRGYKTSLSLDHENKARVEEKLKSL